MEIKSQLRKENVATHRQGGASTLVAKLDRSHEVHGGGINDINSTVSNFYFIFKKKQQASKAALSVKHHQDLIPS